MREVVIQSWCDPCLAEGEHTTAEPIDLTWRNRDVSLDLCEQHAASFHELDRIIAEHGHTRKPKTIKTKKLAQPGSASTTQHTPLGVPSSSTHESTEFIDDDGNYYCPDCDRTFDRPQSLGAHRYRHHGYRRNRG